jgi:hypothetical protein
MSTTYNDLDLTTFPESIDTMQVMQDPNRSQLVKILSYETLLRGGDYDSAAAFLEANPELKDMQITAEKMNRHEQMIIAIERMFKEDIKNYIEAAKNSVTTEIVTAVNKATTDAGKAVTAANQASDAVSEVNKRLDEFNNVVRVVEQGGLVLLPKNWGEENGLYVQTLELDVMKTTRRMRYTLAIDSIGKLFIAGVTCETDGEIKVMSYNKPSVPTSILYCVEEVVA